MDSKESGFAPVVRASPGRLARSQWASGHSTWESDAAGRQVTVDQLDVHEDVADDVVAQRLGLKPGSPVWVRRRRYLLDRRPVQLAESSLPADLVAGTPITQLDPGPGGIYARLAEVGAAPVRFVEDVRSRMPSTEEAKALQLPPGSPVLEIVRTATIREGRAVETNSMILDASAYVLRYAFDAE